MNNIKISIIIPIYNSQKYLIRCLENILNQTFKEIEVLCIDLGSTDDSLKILNEYSSKDDRVNILFSNSDNLSKCKNMGIEKAKGKYLHFINPYDLIEVDAYEKLYSKVTDKNLDIIVFNAPSNLSNLNYNTLIDFHGLNSNIFKLNGLSWNKLIKKEFCESIGAYFSENLYFADYIFSFKLFLHAKMMIIPENIYTFDETTYLYNAQNYIEDIYNTFKQCDYFFKNELPSEFFEIDLINYKISLLYEFYIHSCEKNINKFFNSIKFFFKFSFDFDETYLNKIDDINKKFYCAVLNNDNINNFNEDFYNDNILDEYSTNMIYFNSSKTKLFSNYKFHYDSPNSFLFSKNKFKLNLNETSQDISISLNEYLQKNGDNIFHKKFISGNCEVSSTFFINEHDIEIKYWFSKNNKFYIYNILIELDKINERILDNINHEPEDINEFDDKYIKVKFNRICDNPEISFNNYLTEKNQPQILQERVTINKCPIFKTFLLDDKKFEINYWFSKNNHSYNYNISFNYSKLKKEMCEIINNTTLAYSDLESFLYSNFLESLNKKLSNEDIENIFKGFEKKISIIIPIYNAYEDTKRCIESVFKNTILDFELFLIDDCSTDKRISSLLSSYENLNNVHVIRNETNQGFTKNVNKGMKLTNNDVILLNSDTLVTPNWDQKIVFYAYSDEKIATLTPISNASDISIPQMGKNNEIPKIFDVNTMSYFVKNISVNGNFISPTGNGYCLFIKRDALNDVGFFDEESFGKGYGEETDFTMRAKKKGWKNVRNDSIFIYHKRSASFSLEQADNLKKEHNDIIKDKHPTVFDEWRDFARSLPLKNTLHFVNFMLNNYDEKLIKENVLYITNLKENKPNVDNCDKLYDKFNIFILTLEHSSIKLWQYNSEGFKFLKGISFSAEIPNISILNTFYGHLFYHLKIDKVFLKFEEHYQKLIRPEVIPLMFASKIKIPIFYGRTTEELLNQMNMDYNYQSSEINFKNEKGAVYTAIFGDYENLLDPKFIHPSLDYICFTDNPNINSKIWNIQLIDDLDLDNTRKARTIKALPHKYLSEYDFSIWVDAAFQLIGDFEEYINIYSKGSPILGVTHSWRKCIYEEIDANLELKKDDENILKSIKKRYEKEGVPKDYGLIESGILFRRHNNPQVIQLMEQWNYEIMNFSKRDQLSFDYLCWKNDFKYDKVPIFYWKNQYFQHFYHQQESINNKLTKPQVRFILIANDNKIETENSINSILRINHNIVISILSLFDYSYLCDYNLEYFKVKDTNEFLSIINWINNNFPEEFIYIICSGDNVSYSSLEKIFHISNAKLNIGALIYSDVSYIENYISNPNNTNIQMCENKNRGFAINSNKLKSHGGFKNENRFIANLTSKLTDNSEVISWKYNMD